MIVPSWEVMSEKNKKEGENAKEKDEQGKEPSKVTITQMCVIVCQVLISLQ